MSKPTVVKYGGLELLCKQNTVTPYREGKLGRDKVLIIDEIFKNSSKGDRAKGSELQEVFGTENMNDCINMMLEKGDYPLSTEERKKKVEEKRAEIKNYIFSNYTDEKGLRFPMTRVEAALAEMKAKIDGDTPTDKQLKPILKKLPEIIRVKKRQGVRGVFRIRHQYLGKCQSVIQMNSTVLSERYVAKGAIIEVSLLPQQQDYLLETIAKLTDGQFKFDILADGE